MDFDFDLLPSSYRWISDYATDFLKVFKLAKAPVLVINAGGPRPSLRFPAVGSDLFVFRIEDFLSNFCSRMGLEWKRTDEGFYVFRHEITAEILNKVVNITGSNVTVGQFQTMLVAYLDQAFAEKVERMPFVSVIRQKEANDYE